MYMYIYTCIYIGYFWRWSDSSFGFKKQKKIIYAALYPGYLLLGCSVISVSFIIWLLALLLMALAGLHFYAGLDFMTPSL
jgi:hypothetical protein